MRDVDREGQDRRGDPRGRSVPRAGRAARAGDGVTGSPRSADATAQAISARGDALSGESEGVIAANKLVHMLPQLVEAAARSIQGSRLTVLNGSSGVNEVATGLVSQGMSIYDALRASMAEDSGAMGKPAQARKPDVAAAP